MNMRDRVRNQVTIAERTSEMPMITAKPHGLSVRGMPSMPSWKFMPYMEKIRVGIDRVMEMMEPIVIRIM